MCFPLPLVPFESYMLADDRPAYPVSTFLRLRFEGRFDRAALDEALSVGLSRHPLLAATVRPFRRHAAWVAADPLPRVCWLATPPTESLPPLPPLDVRREAGIRVVCCEDPGRTDLTIQVHHACSDAMGVISFVEDLLLSYARVCGAAPHAKLRSLCPEQLHGRGRFGLTTGKLLRMLPRQATGLLGVRQFLMRTPEPLIPHHAQPDDGPVPADYPTSVSRQLSRTEWAGLVACARGLGVTTHDLLARDFFLTLYDWRRAAGIDRHAWLRLAVPMNLRTYADRRLPAANVVSIVFLDRRDQDLRDPQQLLESIHQEMSLIKRLQLGLTFVLSLRACQWLPGGLRRMTQNRRCAATAVVTTYGEIRERSSLPYEDGHVVVGGAVLRSVDALPPLRPLTCVALAGVAYAGRLHVTLHYDSRVLTAANAGQLIEDFIARVRTSAQVLDPAPLGYGQ
jgi:hypothetical protein